MKAIMANKVLLAVLGGVLVVGVGAAAYLGMTNKNNTGNSTSGSNGSTQTTSDNFIKTGEKSFGLDVCNEMTKEKVGQVIGKPIVKTDDYSNSGSTGCEYLVAGNSFVIIDVGFGDMANQKKGLTVLDRTFKTNDSIKLENFISYTEKGINDVYMNIAPGQKYVRVGRSSVSVVDEPTLIKLAQAVEQKVRSYH